MRKYHPDANGGAYSDARAKRINEAYATLSDPELRAAYDAQLRSADRPPRPEATGPGPKPTGPEPAGQGAKPAGPRDGFPSTKPARKTGGKKAGMTWQLAVLATVAVAAVGFAAGRILASMPPHENEAVSEPGPKQPTTESSPALPGRAVPATRTVASIVSGDIVPRWRPDCSAGNVVVDVQVNLAPNGSLRSARLAGGSGDPAPLAAAEESARLAVIRSAPFALPRERYNQWRVFIVRFDSKDVC